MKGFLASLATLLVGSVSALPSTGPTQGPFFKQVDNQTWIIGNEVWNMTQGPTFGTKLYYKDHDCVGDAVGHYASYSKLPGYEHSSIYRVMTNSSQMETSI
jgi:rhamnogalacturonan endolyase